MISRLIGDNELLPTTFEARCPKRTSKIALVVDEDQDYHFYRQDSNGMWSGKSGSRPVSNLDAHQNPLYDIRLAFHNFGEDKNGRLNYDRFCGYFCVHRDRPLYMKTGGSRKKL